MAEKHSYKVTESQKNDNLQNSLFYFLEHISINKATCTAYKELDAWMPHIHGKAE